jgi:alpha-L-fucosidase
MLFRSPVVFRIVVAVAFLFCCTGALIADDTMPGTESKDQRDARMAWWREAKFGMFIHWGLYAVPAGTHDGKQIGGIGEWIMHDAKIPVAEYAGYAAKFNPTQFDAGLWADIAKAAGMKYMVITAKHHEGFAMFPSKADSFNIHDATPFQRDPLKELSDACAQRGIKFGVYYSQAQDWHHPGGGAWGGHWDKAQDGEYDKYLADISIPQVRELLTTYHPAILWFDTPLAMSHERTEQFLDAIKLRPGLIYNNRLGNGVPGDTETPEQNIPPRGFPGRDWETCMTINDTWGYKSFDKNFKSTRTLLTNLIDICSKGGNYLLNVGPTDKGIIPPGEVERLKEVGAWLDRNGESIYGSSGSPFREQLPWGRCTQKPGKLFLHVFNWPKDGLLLVPIANHVSKARLLVQPNQSLKVETGADGAVVSLPETAPDPIASVVVLEVPDAPAPLAESASLSQRPDGSILLTAGDAVIMGSTAQLEAHGTEQNIGYWTNTGDFLRWSFRVIQPGKFNVELKYALPNDGDGSDVELAAGEQKLSAKIPVTGGWDTYHTVALGSLVIGQSGEMRIELKPIRKSGQGVMNLQSLLFTPAPH